MSKGDSKDSDSKLKWQEDLNQFISFIFLLCLHKSYIPTYSKNSKGILPLSIKIKILSEKKICLLNWELFILNNIQNKSAF